MPHLAASHPDTPATTPQQTTEDLGAYTPHPPVGQPIDHTAHLSYQPTPQPGDVALSLRHLVKVFGTLVAVGDLSLDIPTGSFYGIVGPNGAGKTTTLSMATGLLIPDQGTALVHQVDVWQQPVEAKKLLGIMPDGLRLFTKLSGPDFLTHVGMLHGLDRQTARSRTTDLLHTLGLDEAGSKLIADYSAGMVKKVALASALIHGPSVIVLDEPFESVDPVSSRHIRSILTDFVQGGGTVVLSSHVMETVEKLCTHVAVIDHGHVIAAGTTAEVANGIDLDSRFAQLVGGEEEKGGLSWLHS